MAAVASVSNPPQFGTLFFGETHEGGFMISFFLIAF